MLGKLQERDQISWACSAQDSKLLPNTVRKKPGASGFKRKLEGQINSMDWSKVTTPEIRK